MGGSTLTIEKLNMSPAIDSLGLAVTASGGVLQGDDVNPIKVDSAFTGLLELRNALDDDDSQAISAAGRRLSSGLERIQEKQGQLAAQAAAMQERADRIANEQSATRILQSDIRDVDMTEAIVRFQQVQNGPASESVDGVAGDEFIVVRLSALSASVFELRGSEPRKQR